MDAVQAIVGQKVAGQADDVRRAGSFDLHMAVTDTRKAGLPLFQSAVVKRIYRGAERHG